MSIILTATMMDGVVNRMADKEFTYYDILGIRRDASQETIHEAYRKMAKKLHPDMGGSTQTMNMLTHAYGVLNDPEKRKRYDATLDGPESSGTAYTTQQQAPQQPSAEDLLEQERTLVGEVKKAAAKSIWVGVGLLILGLVITGLTYNAASAGGTYVLAWGPILFGIIYIIRGLFNVFSPYSVLRKAFDSAGYKHKFYLEKPGQPARAVFAIIGIIIGSVLLLSWISSGMSGSGSSSSGSSSSSTYYGSAESAGLKQQYDTCIASYKSIESDLTDINNQMDQYKAEGYTSLYNGLVDRQNSLASQYNAKYNECESYRTQYNNSLHN